MNSPDLILSRDNLVTINKRQVWLCVQVARQLGWVIEEGCHYYIKLHEPTAIVSKAIRFDIISLYGGYFVSQINKVSCHAESAYTVWGNVAGRRTLDG